MENESSAAEAAAIVASGYAGLIVGAKSGMAVGTLFGPVGTFVGCFAGAFWMGWKCLRATAEAADPIPAAAFNVARAVAGVMVEPPLPDCSDSPDRSPTSTCSVVEHTAR